MANGNAAAISARSMVMPQAQNIGISLGSDIGQADAVDGSCQIGADRGGVANMNRPAVRLRVAMGYPAGLCDLI